MNIHMIESLGKYFMKRQLKSMEKTIHVHVTIQVNLETEARA